jgi:hypothetical protein
MRNTIVVRENVVVQVPPPGVHPPRRCMSRFTMACRRALVVALWCGATIPSRTAAAQTTATLDVIVGRVREAAGAPIPLVTIRARGNDGRLAGVTETDSLGRYELRLTGGDGHYVLSAERLGFTPALVAVARTADNTRIVHDFQLVVLPAKLDTQQVRARQTRAALPRRAPGDKSEALPSLVSAQLPFDPSDIAAIASTRPGVLSVGTDTSGLGLSIGGQPPSQTNATLDGATYGGVNLPQEAIQTTNVVTTTYDVSHGQFTGGQVAVTTRSGTDVWGGAVNGNFRSRTLQYGGTPSAGLGQHYDLGSLNGGGGGPLIPGRLFVYGAAQGGLRLGSAPFLDPADAGLMQRLRISGDSVQRFYNILGRLGASPAALSTGARAGTGSALVRLDYTPSENETLMARLDWRGADATRIGTSPLAPVASGGELSSSDFGAMTELTSHFDELTNRLRGYVTRGNRSGVPTLAEPMGLVQVASVALDGTPALSTLRFGGNSALSIRSSSGLMELSDEMNRQFAEGAHRVKAGGIYSSENVSLESTPNGYGTFTFSTLHDLDAGRPSLFTRGLSTQARQATTIYGAAYLGDEWQATDNLTLIYGARLDYGAYRGGGAPNTAIDSIFHLRVATAPSEVVLSPRIGFNYEIPTSSGENSPISIHGGIGQFRGRIPAGILASALSETGAAGSQLQLTCVGPAAPAPDWAAYLSNAALIASTCQTGAPVFSSRAPSASGFQPGFGAPRVWHGSLEGGVQLPRLFAVQFGAVVVHGVRQPLAFDRNLVHDVHFTLADEGNRPVFVPADAVDPLSGGVSPTASRLAPAYGTVRELTSTGHSTTAQFTLGLVGLTPFRMGFGLYYTATRSRDDASGTPSLGGAVPSTAGDPLQVEWGPSDLEVRHSVQLSISQQLNRAFTLHAFGRLTSGWPFSPMVEGDVNGDGQSNDRAFVFDPAKTSDTLVAKGMRSLLDGAPASVKTCLSQQLGRVAERNSCATPWTPALDLRVSGRLDRLGTDLPMTISLLASNVTAGLDYLLHGPDQLHGWGQFPIPDRTLLTVRSFDAQANRFRYDVNQQFGRIAGVRGLTRSPFVITLQVRMTLGADPSLLALAGMLSAANATRRSTDAARRTLSARVVNIPARILAANRSAGLDLLPEQVVRLQQAADSLAPLVAAAVQALTELVTVPDSVRRSDAHRARLAQALKNARAVSDAGISVSQRVLSATQWTRVPPPLREPLRDDQVTPSQGFKTSTGTP